MNNNEAIGQIRFLLDVGGSDGFTSRDKEALNMAINALAAEIAAPPKSNADHIRQMTDEELASILEFRNCYGDGYKCPEWDSGCECTCHEGFLKWLKQEMSEDAAD